MKPRRYWGITYVNGNDVMPDTIRRTRKEAMKACCDQRHSFDKPEVWMPEWLNWKKRGCRAVRVTVIIEEQTK